MNITIPAHEVKTGDRIGNKVVQLAYTTGKKSRTTSINYIDGSSTHCAPDKVLEVQRFDREGLA